MHQRHLLVDGNRLEVPLWEVAASRGIDRRSCFAVGTAERRLQQLEALARTTRELAAALLAGDWRELDVLVEAVRSQHAAETDDGRRKRRYFP